MAVKRAEEEAVAQDTTPGEVVLERRNDLDRHRPVVCDITFIYITYFITMIIFCYYDCVIHTYPHLIIIALFSAIFYCIRL